MTGPLDELRELAESLAPPPAEELVMLLDVQEVLRTKHHNGITRLARDLGITVQKVKVPHGWANAVTKEEAKAIIRAYYEEVKSGRRRRA